MRDSYQDKALTDAGDKLVVVDFTASWCGPCKMISPLVDELADDPSIVVVKVDVDANSDTAEACGISAMPTFQFYKNGEKISEFAGADKNKLQSKIAELK